MVFNSLCINSNNYFLHNTVVSLCLTMKFCALSFLINLLVLRVSSKIQTADEFLKDYNEKIGEQSYESSNAAFRKATNITDENSKYAAETSRIFTDIMNGWRRNASRINITNASADTKRQFKLLLTTSTPKSEDVIKDILKVGTELENIYSLGRIPYDGKKVKSIKVSKNTTLLSLDKHLHEILAHSRDPEELLYVWKGWRDAVGPKLKHKYTRYVELNNIGARDNGYKDKGEYKRKVYEVDNLQELAENFWKELKPFYEEIHAYVRYRLSSVYPDLVKDGEPIPAHLLGNMWAQSWDNIFPMVKPFKGKNYFPKIFNCLLSFINVCHIIFNFLMAQQIQEV